MSQAVAGKKGFQTTKGEVKPRVVTAPKALADEICRRLVEGETLDSICADEHMPSAPTLWRWRKADPGLENRIVQASQSVRRSVRTVQDPDLAPEQWTPLGIMLTRMRTLWDDGRAEADDQREAITIAEKAAPYVHPRLSAVDARITHRDLRDMDETDLIRELALLREQAGQLLRLPAVIDQVPEPEPGPDEGEGLPDDNSLDCQQER
jgi:hypothetical protein